MNVFFVLAIVLGSVGLLAIIGGLIFDSESTAVAGFASLVAALFMSFGGMAVHDSEYNRETVRLCDEKGGIVSQDNHCFVDGKPVEFSPGVWER